MRPQKLRSQSRDDNFLNIFIISHLFIELFINLPLITTIENYCLLLRCTKTKSLSFFLAHFLRYLSNLISKSLRNKNKKGLNKNNFFSCIEQIVSDLSITEDLLTTTDCYCKSSDDNCYEKCFGDDGR